MRKAQLFIALISIALLLTHACSDDPTGPKPPGPDTSTTDTVTIYTFEIVGEYPHDQDAFTQGLVYYNGFLYEGTGLWRASTLRRVELETGQVKQIHHLAPSYFGEGITIVGDTILQLTWQSRIGFIYNRESFEQVGTFGYDREGWGITYDGEHLIMSDGTARLYFLDPDTYEVDHYVEVREEGAYIARLNELEYIRGRVYANVWLTDRIVIVDPATGDVVAWIDCTGLKEAGGITEPVDVLNGIAYDAAGDRLFVTGKLWPKLFEIDLVAR